MPRRANSTNPTGHVWTETRMLKLCVLVIQQTKCQPSALAELWAEAYRELNIRQVRSSVYLR
jgi:hypothetical protein